MADNACVFDGLLLRVMMADDACPISTAVSSRAQRNVEELWGHGMTSYIPSGTRDSHPPEPSAPNALGLSCRT